MTLDFWIGTSNKIVLKYSVYRKIETANIKELKSKGLNKTPHISPYPLVKSFKVLITRR
jgi:hypothetical protein